MKAIDGICKKVGQPDYGSIGGTCHVEFDLAQELVQDDPESFLISRFGTPLPPVGRLSMKNWPGNVVHLPPRPKRNERSLVDNFASH